MNSISRGAHVVAAVMAMFVAGLADGQITTTGVPTNTPTILPIATPVPVEVPTGTTGSLVAFVALICAIAWLALRSTRTR